MKLWKRLLYIIPFLLVGYYILIRKLSDDQCSGLIDFFYNSFLYLLLVIALLLSIFAIAHKRSGEKYRLEPVSSIILISLLLCFILLFLFEETFKGEKWLFANTGSSHQVGSMTLLLRTNKTYVITNIEADFSCSLSGTYTMTSDTLKLSNSMSAQIIHGNISNKYFKIDNLLIPIIDSTRRNIKTDTFYIQTR